MFAQKPEKAHCRHQKNQKISSDKRKMEVFFGNIYTETQRAATQESPIVMRE